MTNNDNLLDVSPDMGFYNLLESYPYNLTRALCEYVDNALQAFLDKDKNCPQNILNVELSFFDEAQPKIIIKDNGVGIQKKDFQKVMRPGMKKDVPSLSEFGIGMKAASLWFGRKWNLVSSPWEANETYEVTFDLDELLKKNQEHVELNIIPREKNNGVTITISKLKRKIEKDLIRNAWNELQEIYQLFTHIENPVLKLSAKYNNITLSTNDDLLNEYRKPIILEYPKVGSIGNKYYAIGNSKKWEQKVNFEFEGNKVEGILYALETSSQKNNPGIRLFRNKRLIKGFLHNNYRPALLVGTANKHAPSRVFGELHLDGQAISNNKGEFQFEEDYFLLQLGRQCGVRDLIEQAETYRPSKESGKVICSSEEEFNKIKSKKSSKINQKPILELLQTNKNVNVGTRVDLYQYISKAIDSNGNNINTGQISLYIEQEQINNILSISQPGLINIDFIYNDSKESIVRTLVVNVVEKEADLELIERKLIPHKAGDTYKFNLNNATLHNLIEQINKLHKDHKGEYNELIACSLRSCFELCTKALENSSKIVFSNKDNKPNDFEAKIKAIHILMNNRKINELISKKVKLSSQRDLQNEWNGISLPEVQSYIKSTHLGAHGSTAALSPDRLVGLGNYLGLFILATDQLLNNEELRNHINDEISL